MMETSTFKTAKPPMIRADGIHSAHQIAYTGGAPHITEETQ